MEQTADKAAKATTRIRASKNRSNPPQRQGIREVKIRERRTRIVFSMPLADDAIIGLIPRRGSRPLRRRQDTAKADEPLGGGINLRKKRRRK